MQNRKAGRKLFGKEGRVSGGQDAIPTPHKAGGLLACIYEQTFFKVDFHVGEAIPGELTRTRQQEIAPGVTVPLVNKEDAILSKLLWIRQGSGKSRQDVLSMLRRRSPLDQEYLRMQAERLGVAELLTEMREQAR